LEKFSATWEHDVNMAPAREGLRVTVLIPQGLAVTAKLFTALKYNHLAIKKSSNWGFKSFEGLYLLGLWLRTVWYAYINVSYANVFSAV